MEKVTLKMVVSFMDKLICGKNFHAQMKYMIIVNIKQQIG